LGEIVTDPRINSWARVLTGYCVGVKPGDRVAISGEIAAEPLLRAIYREVIAAGGSPLLMPALSGVQAELLAHGLDRQLEYISPIERFMREEADASIRVSAETNTRNASQIDPVRTTVFTRARADLNRRFMERAASGEVRWSLTLFPTDAYAQDAEMATDDYAEFLFAACKLNHGDPVAAWKMLSDEQAHLVDWLTPKRTLRIIGPGTDLTVGVAGRTWINSDGKRNFPSGEVFTGPVETSANGVIRCSFPVVTAGRQIGDVRLRFEDGVVVEASAARNENYLLSALDTDEGSRRLGEVAIGTNFDITRFTGQILLDEKIGGTAHVALGAGYPDTGSSNRSAIHWDLISDLRHGGRIEADGELLMVDGRLAV
jgi:aminopeptidase